MQKDDPRRPGEMIFSLFLVAASLFLLYTAYGISGFDALSGAGALPMASTAIMLICAGLVALQTKRRSALTGETLARDILPVPVLVTILMIGAYALLLQPLGFLPTSFLFLLVLIRMLSRRSLLWCGAMSLLCVALIYGIFRLIFSVLMPAGIVPEAEIMAFFRSVGGQ